MDAHPVYWEELLLLQLLVARHFLTQVTHLDIHRAVADRLCQRLEHQAEELVARILVVAVVHAFTKHSAMDEQWEEERAVADDAQKVANHLATLVFDNHHIWLLTRCLPRQFEESRAVEVVRFIEHRQFFALAVDGCL